MQFLRLHSRLEILLIQAGPSLLANTELPPHLFTGDEGALGRLLPDLHRDPRDAARVQAHMIWERYQKLIATQWADRFSEPLVLDLDAMARAAPRLDMVRWWPYGEKSIGADAVLDVFIDHESESEVLVGGGLRFDAFGREAGLETRSSPKEYSVTWRSLPPNVTV